ncbi:ABC transporter permease [Alcaligenes endophyticus]|uniref:ABC transporter permease n=1 Tax=Alcaligenes endophyticus TaxID=1929088 RepID=A0ABT8EG06_9BURK|nr:ABC transporter permease [Alcaligenes endophyticus]MCX5590119.1 ABC transporter permease [Alcaligenes endophyticus]MDN4120218.1 ABC transporter permease [Alcaligenes endophyticus]
MMKRSKLWYRFRQQPLMFIGLAVLVVLALMALLAPWIATYSPTSINPLARMKAPSAQHWFGTDALGRDVYSRVVWGARVSLVVALAVSVVSLSVGTLIGILAGYFRKLDMVLMRIMDGLMAIPNILLAIALMAAFRGGLLTVIIAIVIPEVPRVVRLVRALVLGLRNQPYMEAAYALGTRTHKVLVLHVLPNLFAPLMVQATFIAASAIITEAVLSFLGVGIPPEMPSWGNIMADGRNFLSLAFHIILFPGLFLAMTVLAVNMVGDGLRDMLDPKLAGKL